MYSSTRICLFVCPRAQRCCWQPLPSSFLLSCTGACCQKKNSPTPGIATDTMASSTGHICRYRGLTRTLISRPQCTVAKRRDLMCAACVGTREIERIPRWMEKCCQQAAAAYQCYTIACYVDRKERTKSLWRGIGNRKRNRAARLLGRKGCL